MSPYTLRKRKNIKAPRRYDDDDYGSSPRESSPRESSSKDEDSRESPQLEQLRWPSPPPKRSTKKNAYRGPVIEFNPNLPPAAFPTLDKPWPNQISDQDQHNMHQELPIPDLSDEQVAVADSSVSGNGPHQRVNPPIMFSIPTRAPSGSIRPRLGPSIMVDRAMGVAPIYNGLGSMDNGPQNPIWASNVKKIGELARRTSFDWIMHEMDTSDEEEPPAKVTKKDNVPAWDDLTITHKLDLADTVYELSPEAGPEHIMARLRLNALQGGALAELLIKRQNRSRGEETSAKLLRDHTQEEMLRGRKKSETGYRTILEQTIYRHVGEEDHLQSAPSELAKGKAYLSHCGFDPSLLDGTWVRPVSGNTTPKTQSTILLQRGQPARDVPHSSNDSANESSSQRLAQSTPVRQHANPLLPKPGEAQRNSNAAPPRRRRTAAEMIATHSSPVAPHRVPSREFPVVSAHPQLQTARAGSGQRRPSTSHPLRSSLPSRPHDLTADYTQTANSAPPKARNPTSKLPTPPGEPTLPTPKIGPAAGIQARPETNPKKRTANQATQPEATPKQNTSSTGHSDGPAIQNKRAYNKKATAGAPSTNGADKTSTKPSKKVAPTPTPAASTTSASPSSLSLGI
ncbi:hypothetical protein OEA41_006197 [Lepraria neglecta]|uniref:Uncharacterized protein n=1 Tax=Lepraria neglecta TaxID=209136 RepID=A0AAE0DK08_9LECA|nr:hypothetical protein OEA41_006197 [Lepraria neglecta]